MRKLLHSKIFTGLVVGFAIVLAGLGIYLDMGPRPEPQQYELQIGDTEYLLATEIYPDYTYLLHVELGDGRSIGIKPNGELEFEGELSEQVVEFWRVLAEGVPLFASEWCEEPNVE